MRFESQRAADKQQCFLPRVFIRFVVILIPGKMSKLDMLHSHLLNRMSAVIREIFEEVEAAVKDYREETVRTRTENAKLKRQLRDVLIRTETHFNGKFSFIHSKRYMLLGPSVLGNA